HDFRDALHAALGVPVARMVVAQPLFPTSLVAQDEASRREGAALRARLGAGPRSTVVAHFGRIAANKGLLHLISMAERLARDGRDVHLAIGGRCFPENPELERDLAAAAAAA